MYMNEATRSESMRTFSSVRKRRRSKRRDLGEWVRWEWEDLGGVTGARRPGWKKMGDVLLSGLSGDGPLVVPLQRKERWVSVEEKLRR